MQSQYCLSVLQWNPGPARKWPTQILKATCGNFYVVILQEAGELVPHVTDQLHTCTDNSDLAILLIKDTFELGGVSFPITESSTSQDTWGLAAPVVRGIRRPSAADSPTVTFCSFFTTKLPNNAMPQLPCCAVHRGLQHECLLHRPLGVGGLDVSYKDSTGFLIMLRRPYTWSVHKHGYYKFDNEVLRFAPSDLTAHYPVFLHLCVTSLFGPISITRSAQAQTRRFERAAGKQERKRLRKRLASQPTQSAPSTHPQVRTVLAGSLPSLPTSTITEPCVCSAPSVNTLPPAHPTGSQLVPSRREHPCRPHLCALAVHVFLGLSVLRCHIVSADGVSELSFCDVA